MSLPLDNLLLGLIVPAWIQPLWLVGVGAVVALVAIACAAMLLQFVAPKVAAIARTTAKEAVSQPMFYVLLAIGAFLLLLFPIVPYYTFGEDVKVVKETGLTLIMVLSIILALWTASVSVADEIEGRTALTVLCKPVGRREFILGKFLGVIGPVLLMFVVLGSLFLCSVSYKVSYDSRETAQPEPDAQQCQQEMVQIAPGLILALMEAVVLAAISVAISTRLPMLPNLVICASIYVLGHLVPMLANSSVGHQIPFVPFVADLLATVLPVLEHFNIYGAISTGEPVSGEYLFWTGVYCLLYSTVAMLLALLLFEDRDLA
ncbi:MAG: ABC transporter permease [Thermoguttaceae bacterium]|jgi:ABC-type transport system involved in multi-copper enzyme maturation permease subunit